MLIFYIVQDKVFANPLLAPHILRYRSRILKETLDRADPDPAECDPPDVEAPADFSEIEAEQKEADELVEK